MKIAGIIPSRLESSRFPAKPLVDIFGKTMIRRVYEQASKAKTLDVLFVATDSESIADEITSFNGNVLMTSIKPVNGTERCYEAINQLNEAFDVIINIQGDEPFIHPKQIDQLAILMKKKEVEIGTLVIKDSRQEMFEKTSSVKVVVDNNYKALYFSRKAIPYNAPQFFRHIGLYGYKYRILNEIVQLERGNLETAESLEQLRWLENGYGIHVAVTDHDSESVDTPEDLEVILEKYSGRNV